MPDAGGPQYDHRALERSVLKRWRDELLYQKVRKANERGEPYFFLDGPPYTTGGAHIGTAYNKVIKDIFLRYMRMQRLNVLDRPGFDLHGLPVELAVEEKLDLEGAARIREYGLERFISECTSFSKSSLMKMSLEFSELGIWMDWENPYLTASPQYIEGIWWGLKKAYEAGALVQRRQIVAWCPRCQTAMSDHEVVRRKRRVNTACIKIPLRDRPDEFILVWTTQPWTLPGSVAVGVAHDAMYQRIEIEGDEGKEILIVIREHAEEILNLAGIREKRLLGEVPGGELAGEPVIHPLITEVPIQREISGTWVHKVIAHDYVTRARTGAIYISPGLCPQDLDISVEYKLPVISPLSRDGKFLPDFSSKYGGFSTREVDSLVIRDVSAGGLLLYESDEVRTLNTCWRCSATLIYRMEDEWFLKISQVKPAMLNEIKTISWMPPDLGSTRMREWVEKVGEWCVSKQRYWGIPVPYWRCERDGCSGERFIGSIAELARAKGYTPGMSIHIPAIDGLTFVCPECGSPMSRAPQVLDVWVDASGASWASLGYPQKEEMFRRFWPPHTIIEGMDQVKGWFYSQLAFSLLIFGRAPYGQVIAHGCMLDGRSRKISKGRDDHLDAKTYVERYGADAFRLGLMLHGPIFKDHVFDESLIRRAKKCLNTLMNAYTYMKVWMENSDFSPDVVTLESVEPDLTPEARWILTRLEGLKALMKDALGGFRYDEAAFALTRFVMHDLSRSYLPVVKEVVSTEEETTAKMCALRVMYEIFSVTSQLFAPLIPFIAEEINAGLEGRPRSVFLLELPAPNRALIVPRIEWKMLTAERIISAVRDARRKSNLYLRWPLRRLVVRPSNDDVHEVAQTFSEFIAKMTNVQDVQIIPPGQEWEDMIVEVRPNPNAIGKVYRQWASKIGAMLKFQSAKKVKEEIEKGEYVLGIEGQLIKILPGMVEFVSRLPDDVVEVSFDGGTLYVDLNVTETTRSIGIAREIVRRIQQMRKDLGLSFGDFIETYLTVGEVVQDIISDALPMMRELTRSREISFTDRPTGEYIVEWVLFGEGLTIGVTPLHFDKVLKAFLSIPGVNMKRAKALFQAGFTTPESLHSATFERLEGVPEVGRSAARKIRRFLESLEARGETLSFAPEGKEDIGETLEEAIGLEIKTALEDMRSASPPVAGGSPPVQEDAEPQALIEESTSSLLIEGDAKSALAPDEVFLSRLADVPGVGPSKAQIIYDAGYTDISRLANADMDQLAALPRIGRAIARVVMVWAKEEEVALEMRAAGSGGEDTAPVPGSGGEPGPPVDEDIVAAAEEGAGTSAGEEIVFGRVHLVESRDPSAAVRVFLRAVQAEGSGLIISPRRREEISALMKEYSTPMRSLESLPYIHLSTGPGDAETLHPSDLDGMRLSIEQFVQDANRGIILIDGLEVIEKRARISALLRHIAGLRTLLSPNYALIIGVDPASLGRRHLRLIRSECDRVFQG